MGLPRKRTFSTAGLPKAATISGVNLTKLTWQSFATNEVILWLWQLTCECEPLAAWGELDSVDPRVILELKEHFILGVNSCEWPGSFRCVVDILIEARSYINLAINACRGNDVSGTGVKPNSVYAALMVWLVTGNRKDDPEVDLLVELADVDMA